MRERSEEGGSNAENNNNTLINGFYSGGVEIETAYMTSALMW
jgi:hypothetical protein